MAPPFMTATSVALNMRHLSHVVKGKIRRPESRTRFLSPRGHPRGVAFFYCAMSKFMRQSARSFSPRSGMTDNVSPAPLTEEVKVW